MSGLRGGLTDDIANTNTRPDVSTPEGTSLNRLLPPCYTFVEGLWGVHLID